MIHKPTRRDILKYGVKAGIIAFGVPALLKLWERDAQAALAIVGTPKDYTGTGTTIGTGCTIDATAGNGLLICLQTLVGAKSGSITIAGETVDDTTCPSAAGNSPYYFLYVAFVKNVATTATKTVSCSLAASMAWGVSIVEISGQDTTTFFDSSGQGHLDNGAATITCNDSALTTVANNCAVIAWAQSSAGRPTARNSYTEFTFTGNGSGAKGKGEYKLDVGNAGSQAVEFDTVGTGYWLINAIAVKPATGAPAAARRRAIIIQ